MKLAVDQRELDFKLCLFGPDGRLAFALDSPFGTRRPEELLWPVRTAGRHVIQIEPFAPFFGERRLVLHFELVSTPSPRDLDRARAAAATALANEIRRSEGSFARALPLVDQAIELWGRLGDRSRQNAARLSRLWVAALAADEDVLVALESALPWLAREGEDELLGWLEIELARDRSRSEGERQERFLRALAIHEKRGYLREQAVAHNELARIASDRGRFQLATEHFDAAIRLAERCGDPSEMAFALLERGRFLSQWNRPEDALPDLFRARGLFASNDLRHLALTFEAIGSAYLGLAQPNRALSFLGRAKGLSAGESKIRARTLHTVGLAHQALHQTPEALAAFRDALLHYARLEDQRGVRRGRFTVASALASADRTAEARPLLERTLDETRGDEDPELRAAVSFELARIHHQEGRSATALPFALESLDVLESWPYQVSSLNLRTAYLAKRQPFYELALDVLLSLDSGAPLDPHRRAALEVSDRARSQALRDLILAGNSTGPEPRPSALARQRELTAQIRSLRQQLPAARDRRSLEAALADRVRDLDLLSSQLRLEASAPSRPTISEIQAGLAPDSALLHFHFGLERSRLFVVTPKAIDVYSLPGQEEIENDLEAAWTSLSSAIQPLVETEAAIERVSRRLLSPLGGRLPARRLIVVGDGRLLGFPFGVLSFPEQGRYRPLLADHEIVAVPSMGVLTALAHRSRDRGPAQPDILVFADPAYEDPRRFPALPHTRREAIALGRWRRERPLVERLASEATLEAWLATDLRRFGLIHLATHGEFDPHHPLLSRLIFAADRGADAPLFAHEVYDLPLAADLVVLSGCETGQGAVIPGEGVLGLSHAFLAAGADRVLVTLRPVEDGPTANLIESFYEALLHHGETPEAALRQAQADRWQRGDRFERWAPFLLVGRPGE